MAKYVVLLNWTDQGARTAHDTAARFAQARDAMQAQGVTFDTILWTLGRVDMVAILEAPDARTVATALAQLAQEGNVRTETLVGEGDGGAASPPPSGARFREAPVPGGVDRTPAVLSRSARPPSRARRPPQSGGATERQSRAAA